MAKKSAAPSTNSLIFGGILTGFAAIALIGLICITLFGVGYYSIVIPFYNRDYTKNLPSSSTTLSLADQNFFSPN